MPRRYRQHFTVHTRLTHIIFLAPTGVLFPKITYTVFHAAYRLPPNRDRLSADQACRDKRRRAIHLTSFSRKYHESPIDVVDGFIRAVFYEPVGRPGAAYHLESTTEFRCAYLCAYILRSDENHHLRPFIPPPRGWPNPLADVVTL